MYIKPLQETLENFTLHSQTQPSYFGSESGYDIYSHLINVSRYRFKNKIFHISP